MSQEFGWNATVSGFVQSSFFAGYMATQIPGGYVVSKLGGRKVLPAGVTLWSGATAATPLLAGTLPGEHSFGTDVMPLCSIDRPKFATLRLLVTLLSICPPC